MVENFQRWKGMNQGVNLVATNSNNFNMAIWIIRAGKQGQLEQQFLEDGKAYLTFGQEGATWKGLTREEIVQHLEKEEWGDNPNRNRNFAGQINAFANRIKSGDIIALPSKMAPTIHFGKVTKEYQWNKGEANPHSIQVDWTDKDIPRDRFDQDILYSLGAFMTVCQVRRNNAEERIAEMKANNWFVPKSTGAIPTTRDEEYEEDSVDVETYTRDEISKHLIRKFKGHGMERLIAEILTARGYEVYQSPKGADKGVDLLAASGEFGFGGQKILVQVKTQDDPVGIDIVDRLVGTMRNYNAENAILVRWSGIKNNVEAEKKSKFFEVRFWDRDDIIDELLKHYDKLSDQLRAEVPLKRIWTLTDQD